MREEDEMFGEVFFEATALAVAAFIVFTSHRATVRKKERLKYLTELEDYCLEIRHRYAERRILSDAVFASFDPTRKTIRDFAYGMTRAFGSDISGASPAAGFGEKTEEPYEKLLISVCGLIDEYGDDGSGSFAQTLLKIAVDIREERRYLSKRMHSFKGLAATAAIPCLFVLPLGRWGTDTIPSLLSFYHGSGGVYQRCLILALSFICGTAVQIISDPVSFREKFGKPGRSREIADFPGRMPGALNSFIRQTLDRLDIRVGVGRLRYLSFVTAGIFFALTSIGIFLGHLDMKTDYVHDTSDIESTLAIADSAQINAARRVIPYLMVNTLERGMKYTEEELYDEIMNAGISNAQEAGKVADEFYRRLEGYESEEFDLCDLLFTIAMIIAGWFLPVAALLALCVAAGSSVKEEVMRFEAVIDLEKDVSGMTVPIMLENMMSFASVTKGALIKTIMDYNTNETEAFEHLTAYSNDRSLKRLAGFFLMTDMLGIRNAFDEVSAELEGMREERRLDRALRLEDETMLAGILGVIPGGLVVFGYLLVPFITRSLEMFNAYSDSLGMI